MLQDWFQLSGNYGSNYYPHDNGYDMRSLTAAGDSSLGWLMDPTGTVAGLWNDITGASAQSREFSQQEYLQDKANEYNKPVNEMRRMIEAGINPNVAAAGIAGNGSPSASPAAVPASSGAAAGLQAAAGAANTVVQGVQGFGKLPSEIRRNNAAAQKDETDAGLAPDLAHGQIASLFAKIAADLMGCGIPELTAAATAIDISQGGINQALNYLYGADGIRKYDLQLKQLDQEYQRKMKELNRYDEIINAELNESAKKAYRDEKEAKKLEIDTNYQTMVNDVKAKIPYIDLPAVSQLMYIRDTFGVDSAEFKAALDSLQQASYYMMLGNYNAEAETAYNRFKNQFLGQYAGSADYEEYLQKWNIYQYHFKSIMDNLYSLPDDLRSFVFKNLDKASQDISGGYNNRKMPSYSFPQPKK